MQSCTLVDSHRALGSELLSVLLLRGTYDGGFLECCTKPKGVKSMNYICELHQQFPVPTCEMRKLGVGVLRQKDKHHLEDITQSSFKTHSLGIIRKSQVVSFKCKGGQYL